jgi:hypothetical protein
LILFLQHEPIVDFEITPRHAFGAEALFEALPA